MKQIIKKLIRITLIPFVFLDYVKYKKKDHSKRFTTSIKDFYPCVKDKTITTGFDRHYVYHTSWAARKVKKDIPDINYLTASY
jgi:hypothetical protein